MKHDKLIEYRKWVINNILFFLKFLNKSFQKDDIKLKTVATRTIIEFVKREYMYSDIDIALNEKCDIESKKRFGFRTYEYFIKGLIRANQIDVDILLMMRSEVSFYLTNRFYYFKNNIHLSY